MTKPTILDQLKDQSKWRRLLTASSDFSWLSLSLASMRQRLLEEHPDTKMSFKLEHYAPGQVAVVRATIQDKDGRIQAEILAEYNETMRKQENEEKARDGKNSFVGPLTEAAVVRAERRALQAMRLDLNDELRDMWDTPEGRAQILSVISPAGSGMDSETFLPAGSGEPEAAEPSTRTSQPGNAPGVDEEVDDPTSSAKAGKAATPSITSSKADPPKQTERRPSNIFQMPLPKGASQASKAEIHKGMLIAQGRVSQAQAQGLSDEQAELLFNEAIGNPLDSKPAVSVTPTASKAVGNGTDKASNENILRALEKLAIKDERARIEVKRLLNLHGGHEGVVANAATSELAGVYNTVNKKAA